MAIIPLLRTIEFILISLVSLVVLGICAYLQYLITNFTDASVSFTLLGIGAACLTAISLPLFLALDHFRRHVFTSTILFELVWFAILWGLWAGTASDTVMASSYYFPAGCIYNYYPPENRVCYEFTVVEALAFFNFFSAFTYFIILLSYAVIHALRGKSVWTSSVKEVAVSTALNQGVTMLEGQSNPMPATQYQNFGLYSPNFPFPQLHDGYPQQGPLQGPPAQSYNTYPQQVLLQGPPSQQFDTSLQQAFPGHFSGGSHGQNKQSNSRPASSGGLQQKLQVHYPGYSSGINPQDLSSHPLLNSSPYPAGDLQAQPLSNGHPGPPAVPQQQLRSSPQSPSASAPVYGVHQPIPV